MASWERMARSAASYSDMTASLASWVGAKPIPSGSLSSSKTSRLGYFIHRAARECQRSTIWERPSSGSSAHSFKPHRQTTMERPAERASSICASTCDKFALKGEKTRTDSKPASAMA